MPVLALEIEVNGKRLTVAGAKDLALLSAQIAAGVGGHGGSIQADSAVHLSVMGLTSPKPSSRMANLSWINGLALQQGDSVTFRVVQVEQPDAPAEVIRTPTATELAAVAEKERSGLTARFRATRRKRRAPKRER